MLVTALRMFYGLLPRGCRPSPLTPCVATAGKNILNEEITPLLPTPLGYSRAIQPNHIKFRTCSALAPMWTLPYKRKCWTNSGRPLANSLLWALAWLLAMRMVSSLEQVARQGGTAVSWFRERQISRRWASSPTWAGRLVSRLLLSSRNCRTRQCKWPRVPDPEDLSLLGLEDPDPLLSLRIRIRVLLCTSKKLRKNLISMSGGDL
jgi:hypothetical protein